jgi:hypothetical protein
MEGQSGSFPKESGKSFPVTGLPVFTGGRSIHGKVARFHIAMQAGSFATVIFTFQATVTWPTARETNR